MQARLSCLDTLKEPIGWRAKGRLRHVPGARDWQTYSTPFRHESALPRTQGLDGRPTTALPKLSWCVRTFYAPAGLHFGWFSLRSDGSCGSRGSVADSASWTPHHPQRHPHPRPYKPTMTSIQIRQHRSSYSSSSSSSGSWHVNSPVFMSVAPGPLLPQVRLDLSQ